MDLAFTPEELAFREEIRDWVKDNLPADIAAETSPLRFVTAASLFDGHDAAINIMRRLIQAQGVEVVHLGHNRSVEDVVRAALQEDADGIALSSYQGGHTEYFKYMVDMLRERGAGHIRVFGGGGGTITPEEIKELQAYGVERIYHPNDGMQMGLVAMIEDLVRRTQAARDQRAPAAFSKKAYADPGLDDENATARVLSQIEAGAIGLKALPVIIGTVLAAIAIVTYVSRRVGLTDRLGTLGATNVRFLYGLPFACAFLALAAADAAQMNDAKNEPSYQVLLAPWTGPYGGVPPYDQARVADFQPALEAGMAEQLADATFYDFPQASHAPFLSHETDFVEALRLHLEQHA